MTAIPVDDTPRCPATVTIWQAGGHVEQRCERADGHGGKHRTTMHMRRRGRPRVPWVKEW